MRQTAPPNQQPHHHQPNYNHNSILTPTPTLDLKICEPNSTSRMVFHMPITLNLLAHNYGIPEEVMDIIKKYIHKNHTNQLITDFHDPTIKKRAKLFLKQSNMTASTSPYNLGRYYIRALNPQLDNSFRFIEERHINVNGLKWKTTRFWIARVQLEFDTYQQMTKQLLAKCLTDNGIKFSKSLSKPNMIRLLVHGDKDKNFSLLK